MDTYSLETKGMTVKKSVSLVLVLSFALTLAITAPAAAETRVVEGYVDVATGEPALAACDIEARGNAAQGLFGWMMPVTSGAAYTFESERWLHLPTDSSYVWREDAFQITFYRDKPSCSGTVTGRLNDPHAWDRSSIDPKGTIPGGASWAIVTIQTDVLEASNCGPWCVGPCGHWEPCNVTLGRSTFTYSEGATSDPQPPAEKTVRVADLSLGSEHRGKQTHVVSAAATVVDQAGAPVGGAAVGFTITSPEGTSYTGRADTDASGVARFSAQQNRGGHGTWQACVTSVVLDGYRYDSASNAETCDRTEVK